MVATVATVVYLGLEARAVEVQVQLSAGLPAFVIVGSPDKAVAESRERVRAALAAIGLALPPKRITSRPLGHNGFMKGARCVADLLLDGVLFVQRLVAGGDPTCPGFRSC